MSLMKRHQARVRALQANASVHEPAVAYSPGTAMTTLGNAEKLYKVMIVSVEEDCKRISEINSRDDRNKLKAGELIDKYKEYIDKYMASELNHQNDVLTYNIIWLFDTNQIERALELSRFAIEQGQSLPKRFNRDLLTYVLDAVYDFAEPLINAGKSASPYFDEMFDISIDESKDIHESVRAKYQKLAGIWAESQGEFKKALMLFEKAQELDPRKAKVKTRINQLKKQLDTE